MFGSEPEVELSSEENLKEIDQVARNLQAVCSLLTQTSSSKHRQFGDILDRVAVACDELRTLNELIATDIQACLSAQNSIDSQLPSLNSLWGRIDQIVTFVDQKKQQLSQLESVCISIEKSQKFSKDGEKQE